MFGYILLGLGLAIGAWVIVTYNRFVSRKHHMFEAWSGIDVQLKRRYDLIPKLVETVKAYGRYERDLLTEVTALRARLDQSRDVEARASVEGEVTGLLRRLIAVAEAYPELKAAHQFLDLQRNLTEVEEQIQYARRYYNGTVRELNILLHSFPSNLIGRLFRFAEGAYFEIALASERESPPMGLNQ
jgi:LemA protein